MRSDTTQRNIWAKLGVSACALLLPPVALGAAVFSMLPMRDERAGRPAPGAAEAHVTTPKLRIEAAWPINADSQSLVEATEPLLATGVRREPIGKKDIAQISGPVAVHVTIVTPPAAANPPPPADADNTTTGSIADAYWYAHHQNKDGWTHELDLRPSVEKW